MKEFSGKEVTIMTCSDCNTKCKHCYISYDGNFDGKDLYNLCEQLSKKYLVLLNGTEILLHEEYFDTIQLLGQNYLLTNGLAIYNNPTLMDKLHDIGIKYIDMSYHIGIHDDISFVNQKIIKQNILDLLERDIKTELRVTLNKDNYNQVLKICDIAYQLKAGGIKFTNYMNIGNATNLAVDNALTDDQLKAFFEQLRRARSMYDKEEFLIRRCGSFEKDQNNPNDKFICPAGKSSVVITPNYDVYPCFFLTQKGNEIGKVIDGKIFVDEEFENDGTKCLSRRRFNNR